MDFDILVAFATNVGEYNPVSINGVVAPAASFKANQSFTTVVDNGNAPNLARFYASDDGSYPSIFRACATAGGGSGNMRMFGGVILTTLPTWGNPT
jgi:hypothetical protein